MQGGPAIAAGGAATGPIVWPAWVRRIAARLSVATMAVGDAQRGRFALWLPVCMAAGAIGYFSLQTEPPPWPAPVTLAAALALVRLLSAVPCLKGLAWMAAAAALGFGSGQLATWRAPPLASIPGRAVIVTGIVRANEALPEGRRVMLERPQLDGEDTLPRMLRIKLKPANATAAQPGDLIRVRAMLMRPAPPAYPGAWDLQRDAFYAGIAGYGYALNPAELVAAAPASGPAQMLAALRQTITARVAAVLAGTDGAIAATLLTGATAQIPDQDRAAFRDSGLAHLLAIAGLHIGIVMGLVFGAVRTGLALWERAALRWPCKAIAACTALAIGAAYLMLTGAHVPIIRSFAMACLITLGVLTGRRAVSLRGWALAMAALVLIAPNEVMGVSFQMSFSAVLALIVGYDLLRPALGRLRRRRILAHVAALALTSALAGTFSAPFAAYHFGHIQLYYVVANVAAVPLTAFWVMPAGLIALALMPLHLEALALAPMGWGIAGLDWIARTVANWPEATVAVPHMPDWGLAVLALGLLWAGLWRGRLRLAGVPLVLLGLASSAFVRPPDLLVSADARLIALRTGAGVFVQTVSGTDRFTRDAWQTMWSAAPFQPLPCTGPACSLAAGGAGGPVLLLRGAPPPDACAAALLVSAEPIRLRCTGEARPPMIDRFSVWRDGAHAVWFNAAGVRVVSDRALRGNRPWVPPEPPRRRIPSGLKPAESE